MVKTEHINWCKLFPRHEHMNTAIWRYHSRGTFTSYHCCQLGCVKFIVQDSHCHVVFTAPIWILIGFLWNELKLKWVLVMDSTKKYKNQSHTFYLHLITHFTVKMWHSRRLVKYNMPYTLNQRASKEVKSFTVQQKLYLTMIKHVSGSCYFPILKSIIC